MKRKILLAYDGSVYSDHAIADLKNIGFEKDDVEIEVISAADIFVFPSGGIPKRLINTTAVSVAVQRTESEATNALEAAKAIAYHATKRISHEFPRWKVRTFVSNDPPTWAILDRIDEKRPDLVILGSHGRTGVQRFLLGSVSQRILSEANCSVRIVKDVKKASKKQKVLVCVDNSIFSQHAIEEVATRSWPLGTEIEFLSVIEHPFLSTLIESGFTLERLVSAAQEEVEEECKKISQRCTPLFSKGTKIKIEARRGNPKHTIIDEANSWGATVLFLGAKGRTQLDTSHIGSVASTISAHSPCTIEVVRSGFPKTTAGKSSSSASRIRSSSKSKTR